MSICGTLAAFAFEVEFADAPNGADAEGILLYWGAIKSGWGVIYGVRKMVGVLICAG